MRTKIIYYIDSSLQVGMKQLFVMTLPKKDGPLRYLSSCVFGSNKNNEMTKMFQNFLRGYLKVPKVFSF